MTYIRTIAGTTDTGSVVDMRVNASGRLLISEEAPVPPQGTTPVDVSQTATVTKNGGTSEITYTITNGQELTIQNFSGGGATPNGYISLYYDPLGTGVGMTLLKRGYINISNFNLNTNISYIGDGTKKIRMIMVNNDSVSNNDMTQNFIGYEVSV